MFIYFSPFLCIQSIWKWSQMYVIPHKPNCFLPLSFSLWSRLNPKSSYQCEHRGAMDDFSADKRQKTLSSSVQSGSLLWFTRLISDTWVKMKPQKTQRAYFFPVITQRHYNEPHRLFFLCCNCLNLVRWILTLLSKGMAFLESKIWNCGHGN